MTTLQPSLWFEKIEVDTSKIIIDNDTELVVPVVLTREGIVNYPEKGNMKVYRPADELRNNAFTFEHTWITEGKHPEGMLLMDPRDIVGHVSNVAVDENAVDAAGNKSLAIRGQAHVYKNRASSNFVKKIKETALGTSKEGQEVSFGYLKDDVPEAGSWNGQTYAYTQRNIMANHLALGVRNPRVRFPNVGVGVDEIKAEDLDAGIAGLQANKTALQTELDTIAKPLKDKLALIDAEIGAYQDAKIKLQNTGNDETPALAPVMASSDILAKHRKYVK